MEYIQSMSPPFEPRIHFVLSLLNQSSPTLIILNEATVEEQINSSTEKFLKNRVKIDLPKKKVKTHKRLFVDFHDSLITPSQISGYFANHI